MQTAFIIALRIYFHLWYSFLYLRNFLFAMTACHLLHTSDCAVSNDCSGTWLNTSSRSSLGKEQKEKEDITAPGPSPSRRGLYFHPN